MALTIQQIQARITAGYDQRDIINLLADYIEANQSGGSTSYKVCTVLLSQSNTDAPTVDFLLENTLGFDPVWAYSDVGQFTCTYNGGFPQAKTFLIVSNSVSAQKNYSFYNFDDDNTLGLEQLSISTGNNANNFLELMIEIRVYP